MTKKRKTKNKLRFPHLKAKPFILGIFISIFILFLFILGKNAWSDKKSTPTPAPVTAITVIPNIPAPDASPSAVTKIGIPILMYHYVGLNPDPETDRQRTILSTSPDKLDEQFNWLSKNGFTPITLDTLYAVFSKITSVSKPIVLTFDDGYADFYQNAFPLLRKYNFHAVAFIPTGLMNQGYYLSWNQIKEMQNSGLVSFQGHTVSHKNLVSLTYQQSLEELKNGKSILESQTGAIVNFIAYPFGSSNQSVWKAAKEAGFSGGVGTWPGKATGPGTNMPRIRINGGISLSDFIAKIQ